MHTQLHTHTEGVHPSRLSGYQGGYSSIRFAVDTGPLSPADPVRAQIPMFWRKELALLDTVPAAIEQIPGLFVWHWHTGSEHLYTSIKYGRSCSRR